MHASERSPNSQKDVRILAALAKLRRRLGADGSQIVDHWESDLRAVGIAHTSNEHRLAYIAANDPTESFFVELEDSSSADSELPYSVVGRFQSVTLDELVEAVATHFPEPGFDTSR